MLWHLLRWLQISVRYGIPAILLFFAIAAVYERYRPWPPAESVLPASQHQGRVLVGFRINRTDDSSVYTITYAVFPNRPGRPTFYRLQQVNDGPVDMRIEADGLVKFCLGLSAALMLCAVAWLTRTVPRVA
jgi:hypothetical protein